MPSHLINLRTATVTNSFYFMLYVGAHEYSVNVSESQIYCSGVFSINQNCTHPVYFMRRIFISVRLSTYMAQSLKEPHTMPCSPATPQLPLRLLLKHEEYQ